MQTTEKKKVLLLDAISLKEGSKRADGCVRYLSPL